MKLAGTDRCRKFGLAVLVLTGLLALGACAGGASTPAQPVAATSAQTTGSESAPAGALDTAYVLGAGDKLRLIVYGEPDLSGEFDVTGTGKVSLPLIGQAQAAGLTLDQFEKEVADKLSQGYLTSPKVSAEVLNYRPFYIIGEVDKPGQYPYTSDMTVLNAVAVAGGFTYRANTDTVYITRGKGGETQYQASQQVKVLPGDIVRVPERFF